MSLWDKLMPLQDQPLLDERGSADTYSARDDFFSPPESVNEYFSAHSSGDDGDNPRSLEQHGRRRSGDSGGRPARRDRTSNHSIVTWQTTEEVEAAGGGGGGGGGGGAAVGAAAAPAQLGALQRPAAMSVPVDDVLVAAAAAHVADALAYRDYGDYGLYGEERWRDGDAIVALAEMTLGRREAFSWRVCAHHLYYSNAVVKLPRMIAMVVLQLLVLVELPPWCNGCTTDLPEYHMSGLPLLARGREYRVCVCCPRALSRVAADERVFNPSMRCLPVCLCQPV